LSTEDWDVDYFVRMNNPAAPVDVWQLEGFDADQMSDNGNGYVYLPGRISAGPITLVQRDLAGGDPHHECTSER
jgi:hypothetical protein